MSVVSRPRLLALLATGLLAACGGDDAPAGPDGGSPDARPRSLTMLGSRGACPRELQVDGDQLYWLEGDVLVRSSATTFSPEVIYIGVNGRGLRVKGGSAYWFGNWPVRLDLEARVARPIVTTEVTGLAIVDGVRPVVITGGNRIAEIDAGGGLHDLHTEETSRRC